MTTIERFFTADTPPKGRLTMWNELVADIYPGTFVNSQKPSINAEMWRWKIGDLAMLRPRSEPSLVGRKPDHHRDRVILHLQHQGRSVLTQRGAEADLRSGDFTLCSVNEPYAIDLPTPHELLILEFSAAPLRERVPGFEGMFGKRVPGSGRGTRLFRDFLLSLWRQGDMGALDPHWEAGVTAVFYDLLALALRPSDDRIGWSSESKRELDILSTIEARLTDPELTTSALADQLNVSVRTIQNIFAARGTTPTAYMLTRRLEQAAESLSLQPAKSVSEIAFELGFNDSSYFARCFKKHYGVAPSEWRRFH